MSHDDLAPTIRAAVQAVLDAYGDGWSIAQFVICMGLERVTSDGTIEATPWLWAPPDQADWMTAGLLDAGGEMCYADADDD